MALSLPERALPALLVRTGTEGGQVVLVSCHIGFAELVMRKALGEISDTVRKLRFVPICRMRYRSLLEFQFGGIYPEVIGLPEPIVLGTFYNVLTRTISCRPRLGIEPQQRCSTAGRGNYAAYLEQFAAGRSGIWRTCLARRRK